MVFDNVEQFKMAIYKYAVMKGVGVKFVKNEGLRVKAICISSHPWSIYASKDNVDTHILLTKLLHKQAKGSGKHMNSDTISMP